MMKRTTAEQLRIAQSRLTELEATMKAEAKKGGDWAAHLKRVEFTIGTARFACEVLLERMKEGFQPPEPQRSERRPLPDQLPLFELGRPELTD